MIKVIEYSINNYSKPLGGYDEKSMDANLFVFRIIPFWM